MRAITLLSAALLLGGLAVGQETKASLKAPQGRREYQPEEKDFSVLVPGEVDSAGAVKEFDETQRGYSWVKGDARLSIMYFVERKGDALKRNRPELLINDSEIIKSTIKKLTLDGMPGFEYKRNEPDRSGVAMYRTYRALDGSRALTLVIFKADKLTEKERTAFLTSFKFLKTKKSPAAAPDKELKLLQGAWREIGRESGGVPSDEQEIKKRQHVLTIAGHQLALRAGPLQVVIEHGTIVLHPGMDPKQIDLKNMDLIKGIYKLEGDKLTISWPTTRRDVPRPTNFKTGEDYKNEVIFYQRQKK
jgi:uncharacterized protein (TIGR03067 family)